MSERKFADSYEMNIKKIHDAIMFLLFDHESIETFDKEDDERLEALEERINNVMGLDEQFKISFTGDMQRTIVDVSFNGFENGLRIGLRSCVHRRFKREEA